MIQNERFGTGLKEYLPYAKIIDQSKTSDQYFRLFDVPDKLYVGKNSFRIRINKDTLVKGSLLYIDVIDSAGGVIYHEVTDLTGEDGSRLIVVHVYEDTPPGEASIYIAGRASYDVKNRKQLSYSNDPASSIDYIDFPNIFWRGKVVVIPTEETENEIIFAQAPTIRVKERFEEYKTYQSGTDRKVEVTGSLKVSINPVLTSYDYSDSSKSGTKISENNLQVILDPKILESGNTAETKQISISRYSDVPTLYDANGNFTEDYKGGEIIIRGLTSQLNVSGVTVPDFSCSIIEVIDKSNVKIWPPFKHVYGDNKDNVFKSIKDATNVTASYYTTKTNLATNDSESFVQLEFDNLEPLAGKVDSVAISYKPYGTFGEFVPIGEFRVRPQEYLIDSSSLVLSKSELIERPIGRPTGSVDFDNYWEITSGKYTALYDFDNTDNPFSSQGVLIKSTGLSDPTMPYDFKIKLKEGYGINVVPNTEFKLEFALGLPFQGSIRDTGDLQLDVFISGSSILRDTIQNKDSVKILDDSSEGERISSLTKKVSAGVATYTYYFKTLSGGKIYPVFLFNNALYITIKNISIQPRNEFGYSPNQARLFVPLETLKTNTELVFNVEYLNKKKDRSKASSQVYGLFFSGSGLGSTIIDNGLNNSPVFQIISSSIGDQAVKVSGSTLYSYNPSTTQFSLTDSIFFGTGSGFQATAAVESIFLGRFAGRAATNSYNSNFIGEFAGAHATNSNNSNFIGRSAGSGSTTSPNSNFIGQQAGYFATNAPDSNFLGRSAGEFATIAQQSNFLGFAAGYQATNASNSNFLGQNAGRQATNATNSNFFGSSAGRGATSAANSNFLGLNAGSGSTAAANSNFLGQNAGFGAAGAGNSNFLGDAAGLSAIQAQFSNFLGSAAGRNSTSAAFSNFLGLSAGQLATNASGSNFLGYWAGYQATNANGANFLGYEAGYQATNAQHSNFLGWRTGYQATSANHSNFLGTEAGYQATNANNAVFIGQDSGYRATNAARSIFIGQNSGFTASAASDGIFIGYQSGYQATNAASSIFLGNATGQDARDSIFSNFIGSSAGYQATNSPGSNFIGLAAGGLADTASYSNFIGVYAGFSATASTGSNFIGYQAGIGSSEFGGEGLPPKRQFNSSYSNFIGWTAGALANTASYSNFIGYEAGISGSNASGSNFIGYRSGYRATNASASTFIGMDAGFQATNASLSNFIGSRAGAAALNAREANFIGRNSGVSASFALRSNFIGQNAGSAAVSASDSNFIGTQAGFQATLALESNFIGYQAGYQATSASNSTFIGYGSGFLAAKSDNSVFLGRYAGANATSAKYSIFIGNSTGTSAVFANNSVFIGNDDFSQTGGNAFSASYSNFIGSGTGNFAFYASSSNFIGSYAGNNSIHAHNSNFIGVNTGFAAYSASFSNFIGTQAGYGTDASGSNFIGAYAGSNAVRAGYSNFIGYNAGTFSFYSSYSNFIGFRSGESPNSTVSPNSNNIAIGSAISVPSGSSNQLNIAGLIFGSGSYFPSNPLTSPIFSGSANGRIGINQPNPQKSFDISGSIRVSNLSTSLSAPPTSGTQKMVITDANGDLSFKDIPTEGGSGSSAITIIDESTNLGTATHLKFEGAGVTATLSNSTASISIPGGSGSAGVFVIDETSDLGSAAYLKFEGAGVTATISNNTASISIPGGGSSGSAFPYTGSAQITGSLGVTGSFSVMSGSVNLPISVIAPSSEYTFKDDDYTIVCTTVQTVRLPAVKNGRICVVKNLVGAGAVPSLIQVSGSSGALIDGERGYSLANHKDSVTVQSNGTTWYVIGKS